MGIPYSINTDNNENVERREESSNGVEKRRLHIPSALEDPQGRLSKEKAPMTQSIPVRGEPQVVVRQRR